MIKFEDFLSETFKYRVHSDATKQRKLKCRPGYKPNAAGTACVPISGKEKQRMRVSTRKRLRTVKAKGPALQKKANRRRKKAMRFRKNFGLK